MSSLSQAAALPSRVRKDCDELASNLTSVKAFVAKFVSMGFVHAPAVHKDDAHAGHKEHDSRSFICSDLVSFLFSVEKLCASREAALLVRLRNICLLALVICRRSHSPLRFVKFWKQRVFGTAPYLSATPFSPSSFTRTLWIICRRSGWTPACMLCARRLLRAFADTSLSEGAFPLIKSGQPFVTALNRVLDKKGRRQQFFDSWKPRFFALRNGIIEHWREQKVRLRKQPGCPCGAGGAGRNLFVGHTITNDFRTSTIIWSAGTR